MNLNYHYLFGSMGMVDPTPPSLWMKPIIVVVKVHRLFMGFTTIVQMSSVPADLTRHASILGLECLYLSLVLGITLKFLEEEINLHSEHVCFLDGVHASGLIGVGHHSNLGWKPSSQLKM